MLATASPSARAADGSELVHEFLRANAAFKSNDLEALERGEIVAKRIETSESKEIAVVGAMWSQGSRARLLDAARDMPGQLRKKGVLAGAISRLPTPADFAEHTLEPKDVEAMRTCVPGKCDLKLSAAAMARGRQEVDWKAANATERANAVYRELLADHARIYLSGGSAALGEYNDKKTAQGLAKEYEALLASWPKLLKPAPEFVEYLRNWPAAELEGTEEHLYWAKEAFGPKPVTTLVQFVRWSRMDNDGKPQEIFARKHFYDNHYFQAVLELGGLIERPAGGFYLVILSRFRIDPPTGMLAGPVLGKIRSAVVEARRLSLRGMKEMAEPPR